MAASIEDLDRRVTALERAHNDSTESLKWMLTKLARTQAVQDEHTLRLDRIESKLDGVAETVNGLSKKVIDLDRKVETMPRVMAETVQESEQRLRGEITQSEERLRGEITQSEERLRGEITQSEERTREGLAALLQASEQRLAAAADARAAEIEQRVISAIQSALNR